MSCEYDCVTGTPVFRNPEDHCEFFMNPCSPLGPPGGDNLAGDLPGAGATCDRFCPYGEDPNDTSSCPACLPNPGSVEQPVQIGPVVVYVAPKKSKLGGWLLLGGLAYLALRK